jgi:hypothetical protein
LDFWGNFGIFREILGFWDFGIRGRRIIGIFEVWDIGIVDCG